MKLSDRTRALVGGVVSVLALVSAGQALAQQACPRLNGLPAPGCASGGAVIAKPLAANLERAGADAAPKGFSISLDGQTIAGTGRAAIAGSAGSAESQRRADLALNAADVEVRYDGLRLDRRLNVAVADLRREFRAGEAVTFRASTNYARWIDRAELRIVPQGQGPLAPRTEVLPLDPEGLASWTMPAGTPGDFAYVLRVYDSAGRFDETAPAVISRRENPVEPGLNGPVIAAGEGEDRTARRSIPVPGGLVTVSGTGLPGGSSVKVMGRPVPVDPSGRFVTDLYLPPGTQLVSVALAAPGQKGATLTRQIDIPRSDWFATGLADLTLGRRSGGEGFARGRLAFFAKGLTAGGMRVTTAFDSGEEPLANLFGGILTKNPRSVLDRMDADSFYPTFGDDSTIVKEAPTSGKLFLKLEKDGSQLIWGDFKSRIDHSAYLSASRDLYGAQLVYRSAATAPDASPRSTATLYAARPDSLPQRDLLRGTGGSVYHLKRRDLVPGTENISVEIVDRLTGRVIERRRLAAARDYRIDYFQGRVILTSPLSAGATSGGAVSEGTSGDHEVNLVAQYEYVPTGSGLDGAAIGGRLETWLPGDRLRLGITAMDEATDRADLRAQALDLHYRLGSNSHIEAEVAESTGTGFGRSISSDGGFTWVDIAASGSATRARATRLDLGVDLADLAPGTRGSLNAYHQAKDAGFQTLSELITARQSLWGLGLKLQPTDRLGVTLAYEQYDSAPNHRHLGEIGFGYQLDSRTSLDLSVKHRDETRIADPAETGRRTDLGLRLTRDLGGDQRVYLFGQQTLQRSGGLRRNDRLGLGAVLGLSERLVLDGELSDGTNGLGARATFTYRPDDNSRVYLGYELDPNRSIAGTSLNGAHRGRWMIGAARQVDQGLSYFAEDNYDLFGERRSMTRAYGVTYTPSDLWSWSANLERGRIEDTNDADVDYSAFGLGAAYDDGDGTRARARLEYRIEDNEAPSAPDRRTLALVASYSRQISADWRLLADLDALVSDADQSSFLDGRYLEVNFGYAWRPADNDRWNVLARYTHLDDLPGAAQVSADGRSAGNKQRSHILSVDAVYDPDAAWEFGGKLAYRIGQTAPRSSDVFASNNAGLITMRATYDLASSWQLSGEARALVLPDVSQTRTGTLLTVYRGFGDHAKIGLGYNFGSFSDDLTDTTLNDQGLFLNLQAKF